MLKIGINGFGRIGRLILKSSIDNPNIKVVAINSRSDEKTNAHLFKYDSVHDTFKGNIIIKKEKLIINNNAIKMFREEKPKNINWESVNAKIIIDSTGAFTNSKEIKDHLGKTVKKVIITSPAKNEDITIVLGVNENKYNPKLHNIISNASCTTNCLAPLIKVLNNSFGFIRGFMTTIHSYTNDQKILDKTHKDLRRARAAAISMIPTSTGAAKAIDLILPELKGKLNGISIRVPTPNVSLIDLVAELHKKVTIENINFEFKKASKTYLKGILEYIDEPLVSKDFNGNTFSSIFDSLLTMVLENNMIKIFAWYDNEYGYASRCIDLALYIHNQKYN